MLLMVHHELVLKLMRERECIIWIAEPTFFFYCVFTVLKNDVVELKERKRLYSLCLKLLLWVVCVCVVEINEWMVCLC